MFSGIIRQLGQVRSLQSNGLTGLLKVESPLFNEVAVGDSVAVSGVCLTVAAIDQPSLVSFDVSSETLRKTSLGSLHEGSKVNLELPLTLSTMLHGHIVQGHVDGTGRVECIQQEGETWMVEVSIDESLTRYLVPKGSVTVDGVSLTVGEINGTRFSLFIIPKTWEWTIFHTYQVGQVVNIEADVLAKYVERLLGK